MKKYEEAEQDYLSGLKYKDIADKYDISEGTVRQWKRRYWSKENVTKIVTKKKPLQKNVTRKKPTEKAIEELSESGLTVRQKAFVLEYLRISNATQAYINVYGVTYETAKTAGPRLLTNVDIQNEIKRLQKAKLKELGVGVFDLLEDMAQEARADIGDYVNFGAYDETLYEDTNGKPDKNKPILDDDGNPIVSHKSWVQFKNRDTVDTKVVKSIKMGKDGPVIEMHDRNKSRDKLLQIFSSENDNQVKTDEKIDHVLDGLELIAMKGENQHDEDTTTN